MIRRNIAGQTYSGVILLFFLAMLMPLVRVFDFSSDWAEGPSLSDLAYQWMFLVTILATVAVMVMTIHGQFLSKVKDYQAISYLSLFLAWAVIVGCYLNLFFDKIVGLDEDLVAFGPRQQVALFICYLLLGVSTLVYTTAKFPMKKDMEYLQSYIDRQIDQAVNRPDTTCGQCGFGLKEDWTFCPACGGAILSEESLLAIPMEEEELDLEDMPDDKPSFFKRTVFGKRKEEKAKEKMVLDEEKKKDDVKPGKDIPKTDEELVDDLKTEDIANAPPKRVKCEKCGTLLEIKNKARPLNVRCPSCKYIWLLEE